MLTLLEAKNKQLPKDLIISVDENEITIKDIHKQISKPTNLKNFLLLYKNSKLNSF